MRGLGDGTFAAPGVAEQLGNYTSTSPCPGDLNGDGQPDLVGLHTNGHLYFIAGTEQGTAGSREDAMSWARLRDDLRSGRHDR